MRSSLPILALFTAIALPSSATEFLATNVYRVAAGQTVADEQWVMAGLAETEGTFRNDLFISSGGQLGLNGIYEGNVWGAAGGGTTLGGQCGRNVRLAGKSVRVDGTIAGNAMILAETIMVTTNAVIGGSVRLVGSSIILEGNVKGRASITAARVVTLGGPIGGDVRVIAPDVLFARGARIAGHLTYSANKELLPAEGVLAGTMERILPENPPLFSADRIASRALWFLAAVLAGVPFIAFFPMTTAMASQLARKATWKCLLIGFLTSGALPIFGIMCVSSIIGIPLGALILTAWGILLYLSRIIVGLVLGTAILRSVGTSISRVLLAMTIGLAIIYSSALVPAIGVPVQLAVAWLGMGSLILALVHKRRLIIQIPDELKLLEELKQKNKQKEETP